MAAENLEGREVCLEEERDILLQNGYKFGIRKDLWITQNPVLFCNDFKGPKGLQDHDSWLAFVGLALGVED